MSAHRQTAALLGPIERLFGRGTLAGMDDGQLLRRFVAERDEHAFAGLVERFGPMVAGVCRRRLADPRDVEDAFQATFLVLVRKAASIREPGLVGNWLYGVAARVSSRARAQAIRRKGREGEWVDVADPGQSTDPLHAALDEEIARLPEKYRRPLVLCYLEGLTHEEAADRLRCPVGTVRSRMAWARDRLRARLTRLGAAVPSGLAVAGEATAMSPPVPESLLQTTIRLATLSPSAVARSVSAHVAGLAQGVTRAMTYTSHRSVLVFAASVVLGAGGLAFAQRGNAPAPGAPLPAATPGTNAAPPAALPGVVATPDQFEELAQNGGAPPAALPGTVAPAPGQLPPSRPGGFPAAGAPGGTLPLGGGIGAAGTPPLSQRVLNVGKLVAATSPARDRVSVYSEEIGKWDVYTAPAGTTIVPIASNSLMVTCIKGERITHIAAVSATGGKWRVQELRPPASGQPAPIVGPTLASYAVGSQVYAFSAEADRWDVLDIGPGKTAKPILGQSTVIVEDGDRISIFGSKTGTWETADIGKP